MDAADLIAGLIAWGHSKQRAERSEHPGEILVTRREMETLIEAGAVARVEAETGLRLVEVF